jgi:hypothetical protein
MSQPQVGVPRVGVLGDGSVSVRYVMVFPRFGTSAERARSSDEVLDRAPRVSTDQGVPAMDNSNDGSNDEQALTNQSTDQEQSGRGQGIQINQNTIDDPERPEPVPGDDHLHSRQDVPKQDQGIQINDNTIADKK